MLILLFFGLFKISKDSNLSSCCFRLLYVMLYDRNTSLCVCECVSLSILVHLFHRLRLHRSIEQFTALLSTRRTLSSLFFYIPLERFIRLFLLLRHSPPAQGHDDSLRPPPPPVPQPLRHHYPPSMCCVCVCASLRLHLQLLPPLSKT